MIQADGKIVASGYTALPTGVGMQRANHIVMVRLDDNGAPDATFGTAGVAITAPFTPAMPTTTEWGMAEAYGVALQAGKYVTTGYGRAAAMGTVDVVSFRFEANGAWDQMFGTNGVSLLDLVGDNDRGRALSALPGDRILVAGSVTPAMGNIDALALVLGPDGKPDTTFAPEGYKSYSFGRPDDAFFGAATAPSGRFAAAAGHRSGAVGGVNPGDDSTLLILPLQAGMGAEFAMPVPTSETANDRFLSVAFDAQDKVYATGWVTEGGDNRMVVAKFNADGTRDTTFGTNGIVTVNVSVGPGTDELARDIAVQADGKIVIAGPFEKR
jgi:uncharacterized delta-60 repeat protein